ncbi:MAG: hypothetical protein GF315_05870 [candidate division Zixibacteria bacterium]|nr:hypothetical protein [candidate division Zixibacteria bacterium]
MPRIIHTADIHLGMKFSDLGRAGNIIRKYQRKAFAAIVEMAIEKDADFLVIAGDLFDSKLVSDATYRFVASELRKLEDTSVIVIPGTHDPAGAELIWNRFKKENLPENIKLILQPEDSPVTFTEKDTTFWLKPNQESNSPESPLPELQDNSLSQYHIAVAHGTAQIGGMQAKDDFPFSQEEIQNSGFDYIALGHWHSFKRVGESNAYYPGAAEQSKFGLEDAGNILVVDINDSGVSVEKVNIGRTRWHDIKLDTEVMKSPGDILKELETFSGESNILRCKIVGQQLPGINFDTEKLENELDEQFCFIRIIDETSAQMIEEMIPNFSPYTITGQFVKIVRERMESSTPEMKDVLEDSLKLGCRLLSGERK